MFDDPRSGLDRRARQRGEEELAVESERRRQADRRSFCEPRTGGPWWLMRQYAAGEKFPEGSGS